MASNPRVDFRQLIRAKVSCLDDACFGPQCFDSAARGFVHRSKIGKLFRVRAVREIRHQARHEKMTELRAALRPQLIKVLEPNFSASSDVAGSYNQDQLAGSLRRYLVRQRDLQRLLDKPDRSLAPSRRGACVARLVARAPVAEARQVS